MSRFLVWAFLAVAVVSGCGGTGRGPGPSALPAGKGRDVSPMVLVPAGEFFRGRDARPDPSKKRDDFPGRFVYLDSFKIDKFEVTNAAYGRFVRATGRPAPSVRSAARRIGSWSRFAWSGNRAPPGAGDIPVTLVTWFDAEAYCAWTGKRLPTEAEWEKAARGTDRRIFPWGDLAAPGSSNFGKRQKGPLPSGNFPLDKSPYGTVDMAGNVAEWASDYYQAAYYARSPARNPKGPRRGSLRVVRGGFWRSPKKDIRTDRRWKGAPSKAHAGVGFRCARAAAPGR
jgi:formylglycine-generating enzyme required for sulfatase activity